LKIDKRRASFTGTKFGGGESEGGQKFLPPNPLPFCPPERSVWRAKRAISSVQKRFGFRQINPHKQKHVAYRDVFLF